MTRNDIPSPPHPREKRFGFWCLHASQFALQHGHNPTAMASFGSSGVFRGPRSDSPLRRRSTLLPCHLHLHLLPRPPYSIAPRHTNSHLRAHAKDGGRSTHQLGRVLRTLQRRLCGGAMGEPNDSCGRGHFWIVLVKHYVCPLACLVHLPWGGGLEG